MRMQTKLNHSYIAGGNVKWYSDCGGKNVWWCLLKLKMDLSYDTAVLLGIYPKAMKIYSHAETCTWMFMVAHL